MANFEITKEPYGKSSLSSTVDIINGGITSVLHEGRDILN